MRHQPQGRNVSEIFGENRSSEEGSRIPLPSVALSELRPSGVLTNKTPLVVNGKCGISRRAGTSARFSEKIEAVKARGFGGAKSSPV